MSEEFESLIAAMRQCRLCEAEMQRPPNPIFQLAQSARVLVVGQAPGNLADITGTPFNDPSGDRLRSWLGLTEAAFYDRAKVAIVPMAFCFPGYDDKGADLPPPRRCDPSSACPSAHRPGCERVGRPNCLGHRA